MGAIDKCSIPFPLLSGGSYYVHVPMEGLPFLLQISAPSVAPGLFCCCKTSSSFTINRLFKSADIEGGLVFTYKESMLYVKRSGVYFNIIPLHSGYIFKQGTGDIPNDAIELTIQWIVDNMLLGELQLNENYFLVNHMLGEGALYKLNYPKDINVTFDIIGEGNSENADIFSFVSHHVKGLSVVKSIGPNLLKIYKDGDHNYYVYMPVFSRALIYFTNRVSMDNAISATKVDIDISTLTQVGI